MKALFKGIRSIWSSSFPVMAVLAMALTIYATACAGHSQIQATLDNIEAIPRNAPDSALAALQAIPRQDLARRKDLARFALLYTQAQDRCKIKSTSDSLIKEAVRYYRGTPDSFRKFQAYYYLGQIYQNAGSRDAAMEAYVKAESINSRLIPHTYLRALHFRKSSLYADSYDYDKAIEESNMALLESRLDNDTTGIFQALMNIVESKYYKHDDPFADHLLDSLIHYYPVVAVGDKIDYQALWTELMQDTIPAEHLTAHLDSVLALYPNFTGKQPWDRLARVYLRTGNPDKALTKLKQIPEDEVSAISFSVLSEVLDSLGQPQQALEAYRKYVDLSDSLDLVLFRQDTRFIEERHADQLRRIHTIQWLVVLAIILLAFGWFIIAQSKRKKAEHAKLLEMYEGLKEEHNSLQAVLTKNSNVNKEAMQVLGERFRAIGVFLKENTPESLEDVASRLETLTEDRKTLIETVGLLFAVYYPSFVSMLLSHGLSSTEIGFCCMHVLGYRTSEIGDIIKRAGYYNISSEIRKKLPISGQKLATWLCEKFQENSR